MTKQARRWLFAGPGKDIPLVEDAIGRLYLADETETVLRLAAEARLDEADTRSVVEHAKHLVDAVRRRTRETGGIDALMNEYDLSSGEGVALMCLAESLLRIPDSETADRLIADKLGEADFHRHLGASESLFVNAATWALMLTGRMLSQDALHHGSLADTFGHAIGRLGEPVIRTAMRQAMRIMGHQFVMGRTIAEALERAGDEPAYRYSFDMLGEASLTAADARGYLDAYAEAIAAIGRQVEQGDDLAAVPSISVKLSALCPRFEFAQAARAIDELSLHVGTLAQQAKACGIALTIDAEEADRLELTLAVFHSVFGRGDLAGWSGLGIAVQAYQKRAPGVIQWLGELAGSVGRKIPVRLVKGAYWDTEIKRAQEQGLAGYPVFTRKSSTDVSFLACARRLLQRSHDLYPQFATHNAHAVAWILHEGIGHEYEFQRLHGMGEALYDDIVRFAADEDSDAGESRPCRVYAPVGSHEELLPYLVRRLLENGANTSFVNRLVDEEASLDELVQDPTHQTAALTGRIPHPRIPRPSALFGNERKNSAGTNLSDPVALMALEAAIDEVANREYQAGPIIGGKRTTGASFESRDPADWNRVVGEVAFADATIALDALAQAADFFPEWYAQPAAARAKSLRDAADLFERHRAELVALCVSEGGRTVPDSLAEVREAVDFLRYYACECERLFAAPVDLTGPTGQRDTLGFSGRGVFVCISPWNFPVAIFTGQIAAALAAGNTVLAKPAEQTSLVAARVVELLLEAGVPNGAIQFLPGDGAEIGGALLADARLAGVAFTGSTETAQLINRKLAARDGPLATLIAETGGVNAMIVDSSALTEQVVRDASLSAFNSAGQRCSALRLLCLQEDTADDVITMLTGHMAELVIGDPALLVTDVGPVIDPAARQMLQDYIERMRSKIIYQCEYPGAGDSMSTGVRSRDGGSTQGAASDGLFVPPTLIGLERPVDLEGEIFGPVLHVVRYEAEALDSLVDEINALGYGLTLGIHTRVDDVAERIASRARVGNVYINRNMIGAVVGVQPFGGMGLSGTGPKAGGPNYLARFATEQAISVNTAAVGGNATLLTLGAEDADRLR